jgi:hypothetical protein
MEAWGGTKQAVVRLEEAERMRARLENASTKRRDGYYRRKGLISSARVPRGFLRQQKLENTIGGRYLSIGRVDE